MRTNLIVCQKFSGTNHLLVRKNDHHYHKDDYFYSIIISLNKGVTEIPVSWCLSLSVGQNQNSTIEKVEDVYC